MSTAARIHTANDSHWYFPNGQPCYELPKADGKGMKVPTLADARKLNLLPSVTNVLKILPKPELEAWKTEQAVLAVLTTPRKRDIATGAFESDDVFVHRVLQVEQVQNQERDTSRDMGVKIHKAIELYFTGQPVPEDMRPWVDPAIKALCTKGTLVCAEKILVGRDGYAGRTDLILESPECWWIWDTKSTKTLPDPKKGAWKEHVLQAAAYANAYQEALDRMVAGAKPVRTGNCYISSREPGKFTICEHDQNWGEHYRNGFLSALALWQYLNSYVPHA